MIFKKKKNKPYQNCLLIDDNFLDNFITTKMIEHTKFADNFVVSKFAEDALTMLRDKFIAPDLVFVDIMMRGMNGFEFIEEYKKIGIDRKQTKIFILSSSVDPEDLKRAKDDPDITGFIHKNLTPEKLLEIMEMEG
ncbi:response regulator [Mucilaginibacter sp. UYCu711]|uniref:response regulator n=1 Tax=Mucilaginibacter sp. UYCu711 TaxID=3156339 RepID=UPI003D22E955